MMTTMNTPTSNVSTLTMCYTTGKFKPRDMTIGQIYMPTANGHKHIDVNVNTQDAEQIEGWIAKLMDDQSVLAPRVAAMRAEVKASKASDIKIDDEVMEDMMELAAEYNEIRRRLALCRERAFKLKYPSPNPVG